MSVHTDIRGALQVRAATAVGFPPAEQRSYQGRTFAPSPNTPYARMTLVPSEGRSAVVGAAIILHRGLFLVDLFYPSRGDPGTGAVDAMAAGVAAVFRPGVSLTQGSETVTVDYAERGPAREEPDWIVVQVTVSWRCFSPNN